MMNKNQYYSNASLQQCIQMTF